MPAPPFRLKVDDPGAGTCRASRCYEPSAVELAGETSFLPTADDAGLCDRHWEMVAAEPADEASRHPEGGAAIPSCRRGAPGEAVGGVAAPSAANRRRRRRAPRSLSPTQYLERLEVLRAFPGGGR